MELGREPQPPAPPLLPCRNNHNNNNATACIYTEHCTLWKSVHLSMNSTWYLWKDEKEQYTRGTIFDWGREVSSSTHTLGIFLISFAFLLRKGNLFCRSSHWLPGLVLVVMPLLCDRWPKWGQLPANPQQSWEPGISQNHCTPTWSNFSPHFLSHLNCHQMQSIETRLLPGPLGEGFRGQVAVV